MKQIYRILLLPIAALLISCGNSSVEDDLRQAEMALAVGDMRAAQSATAHLVGTQNLSGLSSRQLARLSLVYMQMADSLDRETNVGQAANCYRRAYDLNGDSASEYYSSLPADQLPYAMLLRALAQPNDTTWSTFDSELPDTLLTDSIYANGLD